MTSTQFRSKSSQGPIKSKKIQTTRVYQQVDDAVKQGFRVISAQGSSRSSKTYNILIFLVLYCLDNHNETLSIVRFTRPAIVGSVYRDLKEILLRMNILHRCKVNKQDLTFVLPGGSLIELFSADDEQKIRGRKRTLLYVNEANELTQIKWQQLIMRTTKFAIVDYNPSFGDDHWLNGLNADPRTRHFISTYKDNPFLEKTIVDEIESLQFKNKSLWQVYGLGLRAVIEGLIFKEIEIIERIPSYCKKLYVGIDFGYTNDPTAIEWVGLHENTLYIDELCYNTQMLTSEIIKVLKNECPKAEIISESADPRLIDEIYNSGLNIKPVQKYSGSVEAGVNKMLEYKICITQRSLNAIKEFRNYTYQQDKEGKWLNRPIDAYNHVIDGVRYVILEKVIGTNCLTISDDEIERSFS